MKHLITLVFILMSSLIIKGQSIIKQENEPIDSLVAHALDKNSIGAGYYECINRNACIILYFQIGSENAKNQNEEIYGESWTTFNILYSTDGINFNKYLIDTIGYSGGSCWAPVTIDSVLIDDFDHDNSNEICVVLNHIPYCDLYLPYKSLVFFKGIDNVNVNFNLSLQTSWGFVIYNNSLSEKMNLHKTISENLWTKGIIKESYNKKLK